MPTLNLNSNLSEAQRSSITNLLGSGRTLNETDARNLAYATGQSNNWQQFVNQSASNYSIGNLAQFAPPATSNINPTNGSTGTIPNLGQSTMGSYFNNQVVTGLSQFEQSILNYTQQQEALRQQRETEAQSQYDQAFAGLEQAQTGESGEALMRRLMAEQGIQDKQNQLVEFQKQLATLQNQYTVANNAIGNLPINTAIIRGQQYLKQQEFAAKATLIQARGAIVEGQLNFAQDLVKGYYEAASVDRQNQISRYQNLLSLADQKLVRLDAEEKDNLNMMISTLQSAEDRQQKNKDKISALLLDPVAAAAWTKTPGLSLDMDYSEIITRLLPQISAINMTKSSSGNGQSTTNIASDTKFQTAINRGISSLKQGETWGVVWNRIKQQFPAASSADIDTALGGSAKVPGQGEQGPIMLTGWASPGAYQRYKENQISYKNETASTIDSVTINSLMDDIAQGATLNQLYTAYPDVSPSLIIQYYNNQ